MAMATPSGFYSVSVIGVSPWGSVAFSQVSAPNLRGLPHRSFFSGEKIYTIRIDINDSREGEQVTSSERCGG